MDTFFILGVGASPERRLSLAVWLQCFKDILAFERSTTDNIWKLKHLKDAHAGALLFLFDEREEHSRNYWEDRASMSRGTIYQLSTSILKLVTKDPSLLTS